MVGVWVLVWVARRCEHAVTVLCVRFGVLVIQSLLECVVSLADVVARVPVQCPWLK